MPAAPWPGCGIRSGRSPRARPPALATRFWLRPTALVPTGLGVWLGTVAVGMALRVLAGQGTAFAFIVVALAFLGLFQLGWRLVWRWAAPKLLTVDANVRSR